MIQDPRNHDVEIQDDGVDPGLLPPAPSGWSDPLTGTDGPRLWDRIITSEVARVARYKRPATVVLVEVVGLAAFGRIWGADSRSECSSSSRGRSPSRSAPATTSPGRPHPLRHPPTETDEIAAINFVERARAACEHHVRAPELVQIAIGWASPSRGSDLRAAIDNATERLTDEIRTAF